MPEDIEVDGASRREFLKRSAVVGAAVWSVPAVTSLPGGRAWAQQYPVCNCNADAFALSVSILGGAPIVLGAATSCVLGPLPIVVGDVSVNAAIVCASATSSVDGACAADSGIVQTLSVVVADPNPLLPPLLSVDATVLTSRVTANCDPCNTDGTSSIASLTINNIGVAVNSLTCNNDVLGLGIVTFDEQTCNGDTLSVNALHVGFPSISSPSIVDVIVAHSQAGATGCGCTACA